ncbi:hypothetical protein SAY87_022403 [Trapa incisa]|uniref:DYW domain-containing protein n=1 Tax=Trapa incisa TaxID=236973 RepID=A0AAN7Q465_9MYRT|nr:hypothetical protein SAY87_022403 [Trapa incisa]
MMICSYRAFLRDGFSKIMDKVLGRALHALCIKGLFHLSTFHINTLIYFYSRIGRIDLARYLFDRMPDRNQASWNTVISGHVQAGQFTEAVSFFRQHRACSLNPNGFILASLVTGCDRSGCMLEEGTQLHGLAVKIGLTCDVYVGTSILHLYGAYGLISLARKFFDEMPHRNVVSWTSLMVGYMDYGEPWKVIELYRSMGREGKNCNENTFATVVSSCASLEKLSTGLQVLGHIMKLGLESHTSVGNSLISMFGSFGSIRQAWQIFDHVDERDMISWNAIIFAYSSKGHLKESLDLFHKMRFFHDDLNSTTLSTLLSASGSPDNLKWGKGIHSLVVKSGLSLNICVGNTLLNMYSEAGIIEDTELAFNEMPEKDSISWNSMIACYVLEDRSLNALELFIKMLSLRREINYVTFTSALSACSSPKFLIQGKIVHTLVILVGLQDNLIVNNALITMYGKLQLMSEAKKVFQKAPRHDIVTWNALIGGHAENSECEEAIKSFKLLREEGSLLNYITIMSILSSCMTSNDLMTRGMPIHALTVINGFEFNNYIQNSLISMYVRCGDYSLGNQIFQEMDAKDPIAWNSIISVSAHQGYSEEAIKLFRAMIISGVEKIDNFSFSGGFAAAANSSALEEGRQLHALVVKLGLDYDLYVINAMMDMYAKCGELYCMMSILPETIERSRMSWNVMISAFARHGCLEEARKTFHEMVELGIEPDHVTFVALLSACSHGGLVDEGLGYYNSMKRDFNVSPGIEHCVCIVDLLGRSGRFLEAETFIEKMPVTANDHIWRSLLSACKVHGNLKLGRRAAEQLFKLDPSDDSAYVLYSNICANSSRWEDMESVRWRMGSIKKKPACSWVNLKDSVNSFGMGDKSHPQAVQIYTKLEELRRMIKEAGYVPDTTFALQDTDDEQKEHNLWNHSERLALAFALINVPKGSTIRIFKNLRVCGDCHSVYKFVSKIVNRRIILRDAYRFHHFEGGLCSCHDYW